MSAFSLQTIPSSYARFSRVVLAILSLAFWTAPSLAAEYLGASPYLQGTWSVDCNTSPHLWRIYIGDKAIGPVPLLDEAVKTTVNNGQMDVSYSDGFVDRFEIISGDSIRYLYQFTPNGDIYRDWTRFGDIVLHRCHARTGRISGVATVLRGGWSVDCSRPRHLWRIYTADEAIGPNEQRYGISSTEQIGPALRVKHDSGGGEVFVLTDNDTLQYIYDFKDDDVITRRWIKKQIVLHRCEAPAPSAMADNRATSVSPFPGGSSSRAFSLPPAARRAMVDEQNRKVAACVASKIGESFADSPEGKTFISTVVTWSIEGKAPSAQDVMKQYAAANATHKLKESGHTMLAMLADIALFIDCIR